MLMLFFNFLDVKINPYKLFRKELLVTFFLSVILMPVIAYYILSVGFVPPYRIGLLLVAASPTGIMGIILLRYLRHNDSNLAFSNFLFSTFGAILFIPVVLKLILGQTVEIEMRPIMGQTAALIIIPFVATRLVRRFCQDNVLMGIKKASKAFIPALVFLIIATSIGSASDELEWNLTLLRLSFSVFIIYMIQGGLGYMAGSLTDDRKIRNTLALISSSRNIQIVLAIAILNFSPLCSVPIIIATISHHITNAFWLWILQKN